MARMQAGPQEDLDVSLVGLRMLVIDEEDDGMRESVESDRWFGLMGLTRQILRLERGLELLIAGPGSNDLARDDHVAPRRSMTCAGCRGGGAE